ncbi:MAG: NAD(P)H-hydrate epimerase [Planctomycetota bacterium]
MRYLSCAQVRALDHRAITRAGIPGIVLMENAAIRFVEALVAAYGRPQGRRYAVICGTGNNGGDGFAIARHLANAGGRVTVLFTGAMRKVDPASDAGVNAMIAKRMGLSIRENIAAKPRTYTPVITGAAVVIDALFGTGLARPVEGSLAVLIRAINRGRIVAAVDIPSGIDGDTGRPLGVAVAAGLTVTFAAAKRGFRTPASRRYTGRVVVADISIPRRLYPRR